MSLLRHLAAILLLPVMVAVVVPRWLLATRDAVDTRWPAGSSLEVAGRVLGVALCMVGVGLVAWCITLFARVGRGTLAPWDPTRHLVAVGPYRYVRNPMISGVATLLAGQTVFWGSRVLATWLGAFVAFNHLYFLIAEEPGLARRFGAEYDAYKAAVPRWLPRRRPWRPDAARTSSPAALPDVQAPAPVADDDVVDVASSDGRHRARLRRAGEIRFGPAYYRLDLDGRSWGKRLFGDAHLWSPDDTLFAVQEWLTTNYERGPRTRLLIIDVDARREIAIAETERGFVTPLRFDGDRVVYEQRYASGGHEHHLVLPARREWSSFRGF